MNWPTWSAIWSSIAPAVGDHLWQSTLFAMVAGVLAWYLRKNQARVRYGLWLAASLKFLVPFSFLVSLGGQFAWLHATSRPNAEFYVSVEKLSRPFSLPVATTSSTSLATFISGLSALIPVLVVGVWLCGVSIVLLAWYRRWRKVSLTMRQAIPVHEGDEAEALRRVEQSMKLSREIPLLLSSAALEPGIFGIVRPVLIWPRDISKHLLPAHLESVLAHELCHVRRHDNLAAALHMAVEAIFWFHPLVWWIGRQLVEERELACDEAVLASGNERQIYAESILKICEFCVSSPLNCVSGVTGADLKKRITHIMAEDVMSKLDFSKKLLLSTAGIAAVVVPLTFGLLGVRQIAAQSPLLRTNGAANAQAYETSSIKINQQGTEALRTGGMVRQKFLVNPGEFSAENTSLQDLLRFAYGVEYFQIAEVPPAFSGKLLDVEGKASSSVREPIQKLDENQRQLQGRQMMQTMLEKDLRLRVHRETRNLPAFSLSVGAPEKLQEVKVDCDPSNPKTSHRYPGEPLTAPCGMVAPGLGILAANTVTMKKLAESLSSITGRMVTDRTDLPGKYSMNLKWNPDPNQFPDYGGPRPQSDPNGSTLQEALLKQLGLKLEPQTAPVEVLVVDHVELPANN